MPWLTHTSRRITKKRLKRMETSKWNANVYTGDERTQIRTNPTAARSTAPIITPPVCQHTESLGLWSKCQRTERLGLMVKRIRPCTIMSTAPHHHHHHHYQRLYFAVNLEHNFTFVRIITPVFLLFTPLEPQSRIGNKPVKFQVNCPKTGLQS